MVRQRFTLRARLVVTLLLLTMAGLLTSGFIINNELKNYMLERADRQLEAGLNPLAMQLNAHDGGYQRGPKPLDLPAGTFAQLYNPTTGKASGQPYVFQVPNAPTEEKVTAQLDVPAVSPADIQAVASAAQALRTTVSSGSNTYRVLLVTAGSSGVVAVGMPIADIDATLGQLLWLELGVGVAVLLVLGAFTYVIVRTELRPLERMSDTASQIAGGDLSHRVDEASGGTEVGQLGHALNTMLGRIEGAFAAKQASEDRLRRFVGDASHELRTPLTSIRGYAEMFNRGAGTDEGDLETIMRRIEQESQRMSGLVDDLLLLARLDQQRPLRQEEIDLPQLLTDVEMDAQAAHPEHTIVMAPTQPCTLTGDEDALRQVVVNLMRNACVHTPPGTRVELSMLADQSVATVIVRDYGPGVPPELAAEVFERFTRADSSRGRDAGGSGLGLSIVAAIVSAHGGTVAHSVTPGGGATFALTIPRNPEMPPAAHSQ